MSERKPSLVIQDILTCIEHIQSYTSGLTSFSLKIFSDIHHRIPAPVIDLFSPIHYFRCNDLTRHKKDSVFNMVAADRVCVNGINKRKSGAPPAAIERR